MKNFTTFLLFIPFFALILGLALFNYFNNQNGDIKIIKAKRISREAFHNNESALHELKEMLITQSVAINELRRQHKHLLLLKEEREFKKTRTNLYSKKDSIIALSLLSPIGKDIISNYEKKCAAHENGKLTIEPEAISSSLLGGYNGGTIVGAQFIDTLHLSCSTYPQLICGGTAGCPTKIIINSKKVFDFGLNRGLETITTSDGEHILLMELHGTSCGTWGANACYRAMRWDGEKFLTVK